MPEPEAFPIVGVIYTVTIESPDHQTFEFNSWSNVNPYDAALALYTAHPSDSARIQEQWVRRSDRRVVLERGYGRNESGEKEQSA